MTVSVNNHKAVVVMNDGAVAFGFPHVYSAAAFIERQIVDPSKSVKAITDAFSSEGVEIGPDTYKILSVDDYFDVYGEDDDESIDTLPVVE